MSGLLNQKIKNENAPLISIYFLIERMGLVGNEITYIML